MHNTNRRTFILQVASGGVALAATQLDAQAAPARVLETDAQAVALGFKDDTNQVDQKKYPKHTKDEDCGKCNFYSGKPGDKLGPCAIFGGKDVPPGGWCSAYVKKA
jgi:hypothetical protein